MDLLLRLQINQMMTVKQYLLITNVICAIQLQSAGIESKKSDAVDFSTVGKDKTEEFLTKYLKKEAKLNDKDHKSSFKGN